MHIEQGAATFPGRENPHPWLAGREMICGDDADKPDEKDPARTPHPGPGGKRGNRGPDADPPDSGDPARNDHPVPGRKP